MANLSKLNESIEELEENANKIQHLGNALDGLQHLLTQSKEINEKQNDLKIKTDKVHDNVSEFLDEQNILGNTLKKDFKDLSEGFSQLNKTQRSLNDDVIDSVKDISGENSKLYMDQRRHFDNQLDLNSTDLKSFHDKQKREIDEKIEAVHSLIKEIDEHLLTRLDKLDKTIILQKQEVDERLEKQEKGISVNRVFIIITLLVGVGNIVIQYL